MCAGVMCVCVCVTKQVEVGGCWGEVSARVERCVCCVWACVVTVCCSVCGLCMCAHARKECVCVCTCARV